MNNIFTIQRFGLVLSKDIQENLKRYLLQFFAMFGMMFIIFTWVSLSLYPKIRDRAYFEVADLDNRILTIACFMFFGFGILMASTLMEPMRNKTGRISFLSNPASNFEKFFSRWFIVTIGYIIAFFVSFWMADIIRVMICSIKYSEVGVRLVDFGLLIGKDGISHSNVIFNDIYVFNMGIGLYLFIQSLFVLGATFWEKLSFIKTFVAVVIISLLFFLLFRGTIYLFYSDFSSFYSVIDSLGLYDLSPEPKDIANMICSGFVVLFILNSVLAFFRFKESEIIKRL